MRDITAAQAGPDLIARAAQLRRIFELPATRFKAVNVTDGLISTPGVQSVGRDPQQVYQAM
jgi:hypothetical protein